MIHKIFTIHDVKAQAYLPPFLLHTRAMATRVFHDCINSEQHQFAKHPEDYTLFEVGHFNDQNANIQIEKAPTSLGNGVEFVTQETISPQGNSQNDTPIGNDPPVLTGPSG